MTTKVVVKAITLNAEGHVLLLRRSATDKNRPGDWDYPGGGPDEGEDFSAAVSREIREEAGLTISPNRLRMVYANTEPKEGESIIRLLYVCHADEGQQISLSHEHDEFRWLPIDDALETFQHRVWAVGLRYARDNDLLD